MISEFKFSQKLRHELERQMPGALILKFADRFTSGIPDIAVILNGKTTWIELKVGNNKPTLIQMEMLKKAHGYIATLGKLNYCILEEVSKSAIREHTTFWVGIERLAWGIREICQSK